MEKLNNQSLEVTDPIKKEKYINICEGEPDAIFILAKTLVDGKHGERKIGGYNDVDIHNTMSGGHARNKAAVELYKYFPKSKVIPGSWIKNDGPISYARVSVEQIKKYGVPDESIEIQEESYSTFTEMLTLAKLICENKWKHPIVLTNEFQIRRAKALFEHMEELHDPAGEWKKEEVQKTLKMFKEVKDKVNVTFVSVEDVLSLINPRFAKIVEEAKKLPLWNETMEKENHGANLIEKGEYWKDSPSTTITKN